MKHRRALLYDWIDRSTMIIIGITGIAAIIIIAAMAWFLYLKQAQEHYWFHQQQCQQLQQEIVALQATVVHNKEMAYALQEHRSSCLQHLATRTLEQQIQELQQFFAGQSWQILRCDLSVPCVKKQYGRQQINVTGRITFAALSCMLQQLAELPCAFAIHTIRIKPEIDPLLSIELIIRIYAKIV
ncbi:hypothetical protein M1466_00250 [Candidatus Dependentiae bacterium]|nr:hypothetical protein [Candidatus Dependentiae bacterium]